MAKLIPLPKLLEKTQKAVNSHIRERDKGNPCISCGSNKANQAGHYFPVKGHSRLRFHLDNIHLQCSYCNLHLAGNQAHYRIGLVQKIGLEKVLELEELAVNNRVHKWTRDELLEIIQNLK